VHTNRVADEPAKWYIDSISTMISEVYDVLKEAGALAKKKPEKQLKPWQATKIALRESREIWA
jgi:hypothetical protein